MADTAAKGNMQERAPVIVVMGAVQLSLGMILFTRGSRVVAAAQLSLLALVEPMLAPLWAWLIVAEVPAPATVFGGLVILSAVAVQVLLSHRRRAPLDGRPHLPRPQA